jgi:hypothetical protein
MFIRKQGISCLQEAAADCLQNIRKLALACEKFRYQHLKN